MLRHSGTASINTSARLCGLEHGESQSELAASAWMMRLFYPKGHRKDARHGSGKVENSRAGVGWRCVTWVRDGAFGQRRVAM